MQNPTSVAVKPDLESLPLVLAKDHIIPVDAPPLALHGFRRPLVEGAHDRVLSVGHLVVPELAPSFWPEQDLVTRGFGLGHRVLVLLGEFAPHYGVGVRSSGTAASDARVTAGQVVLQCFGADDSGPLAKVQVHEGVDEPQVHGRVHDAAAGAQANLEDLGKAGCLNLISEACLCCCQDYWRTLVETWHPFWTECFRCRGRLECILHDLRIGVARAGVNIQRRDFRHTHGVDNHLLPSQPVRCPDAGALAALVHHARCDDPKVAFGIADHQLTLDNIGEGPKH
mmetsp:Transcript_35060/g.98442  ORF Transcript_35060/g.98442 Transcript_35060/m.98442 type:complete len:283 (-) Transcript_35060:1629-2477(-)